jgi:hypothetical protein
MESIPDISDMLASFAQGQHLLNCKYYTTGYKENTLLEHKLALTQGDQSSIAQNAESRVDNLHSVPES